VEKLSTKDSVERLRQQSVGPDPVHRIADQRIHHDFVPLDEDAATGGGTVAGDYRAVRGKLMPPAEQVGLT
jgi:hypothetical protein